MQECNAEEVRFETEKAFATVTAIGALRQTQTFVRYPAYIGLDVQKETITVAVAHNLTSRDKALCLLMG